MTTLHDLQTSGHGDPCHPCRKKKSIQGLVMSILGLLAITWDVAPFGSTWSFVWAKKLMAIHCFLGDNTVDGTNPLTSWYGKCHMIYGGFYTSQVVGGISSINSMTHKNWIMMRSKFTRKLALAASSVHPQIRRSSSWERYQGTFVIPPRKSRVVASKIWSKLHGVSWNGGGPAMKCQAKLQTLPWNYPPKV